MKLVLFDIDGTLMTCGGAGMAAMQRTADALFEGRVSFDGIVPAGSMDPHLYREALERSQALDLLEHHDTFRARYVREIERTLGERRDRVRAFDGVHALLDDVFARDDAIVPGVLTGNYGDSARVKLTAVEIDATRFSITAFGDEADTRPGLVELAMRRWSEALGRDVHADEVLVVGDTPRDVDCAAKNGVACLAVATGHYGADDLRAAGATVVLDDLSDAFAFWELVSA